MATNDVLTAFNAVMNLESPTDLSQVAGPGVINSVVAQREQAKVGVDTPAIWKTLKDIPPITDWNDTPNKQEINRSLQILHDDPLSANESDRLVQLLTACLKNRQVPEAKAIKMIHDLSIAAGLPTELTNKIINDYKASPVARIVPKIEPSGDPVLVDVNSLLRQGVDREAVIMKILEPIPPIENWNDTPNKQEINRSLQILHDDPLNANESDRLIQLLTACLKNRQVPESKAIKIIHNLSIAAELPKELSNKIINDYKKASSGPRI